MPEIVVLTGTNVAGGMAAVHMWPGDLAPADTGDSSDSEDDQMTRYVMTFHNLPNLGRLQHFMLQGAHFDIYSTVAQQYVDTYLTLEQYDPATLVGVFLAN